jgi:hypothetical protein
MTRGDALLVAGYAIAAVPALRLRSVVTSRDRSAVALLGALEVGHVLVAAGWALKGRRLRALVNCAAVVAYPALWAARAPGAAGAG